MNKEHVQSYKDVSTVIDEGLRRYMLGVFSYMSAGLAFTAIIAYLAGMSSGFVSLIFSSPLSMAIIFIAQIAICIYLTTRISSISPENARILFFVYAAILGLSLSVIFLVYSSLSIVNAFFVTSSMFLAMVIYGYTTGKDLTSMGSFLFMGLIGLIIASLVNIFTRSPALSFIISAVGVIIFTGLTAYDTQAIKSNYLESDSSETAEKKAIIGALMLYLDFINLFLHLLRFLGVRNK